MPGTPALILAPKADHVLFPQTSIVTDGFRSLADGETVEFYVESGDDGRTKAVQVTGPGGAPPQGARPPCANCHSAPALAPRGLLCACSLHTVLVRRSLGFV